VRSEKGKVRGVGKTGREQWVCLVCGYNRMEQMEERCPFCGAPKESFITAKEAGERYRVRMTEVREGVYRLLAEPRLGLEHAAYSLGEERVLIDCPSVFNEEIGEALGESTMGSTPTSTSWGPSLQGAVRTRPHRSEAHRRPWTLNPYGPRKETWEGGARILEIAKEGEYERVCGFHYALPYASWRKGVGGIWGWE
jgi:hypothetical protein